MAERRSVPLDRKTVPEKVDIQMTPMIDIVFQLMAFFLMTFQVAPVEDDFQMKLPKSTRSPGISPSAPETIEIRLGSDAAGNLADLRYAGRSTTGARPTADAFRRLRTFVDVRIAAARAAGQAEPEVKLDADDALRYEHIIAVIEAVQPTGDAPPRVIRFGSKQ